MIDKTRCLLRIHSVSLQEDRIMSRTVTIPQGLLACALALALSAGMAFAEKEVDIDGTQSRAACPGPDDYGYTCDPECAFEFIDITTTGTLIGDAVGDDVLSAPVAINPFDFYGTIVNAFQVSSNGFLSAVTTSFWRSARSMISSNADITTTLTFAYSPRMRLMSSRPSMRGIIRSTIANSTSLALRTSSASKPSAAR